MKNVNKVKSVIKQLVSEQINTDRSLVQELDSLNTSLKKLNKDYRALINSSFSRVVLDDGQNGQEFDVQLYPVGKCPKEGTFVYDMRGYFNNSDRVYKKGLHLDDIKEFIDKELSKCIGEENSYQRKALEKGKKPYWDDKDYKYTEKGTVKEVETDQMEEVKNFKKQSDFSPEDMAERKLEEMGLSLGLDELAEKIENSIWGAIKREGTSTHEKTAKADHDVKDEATAKSKHILTKSKLRRAKTKKIEEKSKDVEHSENMNETPNKVGTPKVKDFKDDKRKATNESKKKSLTEITDLTNAVDYTTVVRIFASLMDQINVLAKKKTGFNSFFGYESFSVDYDGDEENVSHIMFPTIDVKFDANLEPTDENVEKIKRFLSVKFKDFEVNNQEDSDGKDTTKWIGISGEIPEITIPVESLRDYFEYLVAWSDLWIKAAMLLGTKRESSQIDEGAWDRFKANVAGAAKGVKSAASHKLDKWQAAGDAVKSKAFGDVSKLKQARAQQKKLADKERYRSGGKTGKRSIYQIERQKVAARILVGTYSKRMDAQLNDFKSDMQKSFGIEPSKITSFLYGIGLTNQANSLKNVAEIIRIMKLTEKSTMKEGLWNRTKAGAKGLGTAASTIKTNLQGRDADIQDPRAAGKAKRAQALVDQFQDRMLQIISNMKRDFEKVGLENKNFQNLPVKLEKLIQSI